MFCNGNVCVCFSALSFPPMVPLNMPFSVLSNCATRTTLPAFLWDVFISPRFVAYVFQGSSLPHPVINLAIDYCLPSCLEKEHVTYLAKNQTRDFCTNSIFLEYMFLEASLQAEGQQQICVR